MTQPAPAPTRAPVVRSLIVLAVVALIAVGLSFAGSARSAEVAGLPLFTWALIVAFGIQVIVFVPSALVPTERYFDLTGSLTYISVTVALLVLAPERTLVTWLLAGMVVLWAVRLGSFLFIRVTRSGSDGRFDQIKRDPLRFFSVWVIQGLWVSMTALAAWFVLSSTPHPSVSAWTIVGVLVWALGFGIEVVADAQKNAFRANEANKGRFITSGLWSVSRHPNYFGEILLWVGVALVALPALEGWQYVGLISPVFVAFLLIKVSGIPLLEKRAQERWGESEEYRAYVARTPVLVPFVGRRG
ncbi:MAG: DUF1295 domain-containing protein [Dermabacter sp.]|nr:DUF1295 domain-containing protein [Dermabacter sp.]